MHVAIPGVHVERHEYASAQHLLVRLLDGLHDFHERAPVENIRELRAELQHAAPEQLRELQDRLVRVREGLAALAGASGDEGRARV